jgi:hypothetical protein
MWDVKRSEAQVCHSSSHGRTRHEGFRRSPRSKENVSALSMARLIEFERFPSFGVRVKF